MINMDLMNQLRIIGVNIGLTNEYDIEADIEETIIRACYEVENDPKVLSYLFSWLIIHHNYILTEKFLKVYKQVSLVMGESPYFIAVCAYCFNLGDHRFKKMCNKLNKPFYMGQGSEKSKKDFIKLKGAISYLQKLNIFVPTTYIRIRRGDALPPDRLAVDNLQYRNRLLYGANWRADIITAIESTEELSSNPYQISKKIGCSYPSVLRVYKEYEIVYGMGDQP